MNKSFLNSFFNREEHPRRGLMAFEWVIMSYLLITLVVVLIFHERATNAPQMIWFRVGVLALTMVLWGVYRLWPCLALRALRAGVHLVLLGLWYPDTFEMNKMFVPNLDHVFAAMEQGVFGFQPALVFAEKCCNHVFSELMCLGYSSYYPIIGTVTLFYLFCRRQEFERAVFVIIGAFFIHYVIFDLLPVSGPQFYYYVVGEDQIAQGVFPNIHDFYATGWDGNCLSIPGWKDGFFHHLVQQAHDAGERPTAAFPSSHVSVTVALLCLAWHTRNRWLFYCLLPLGILMFFGTFYIKAHYAIDAIAGLVSGGLCYWLLMKWSKDWKVVKG